jgi:hypothetical protein
MERSNNPFTDAFHEFEYQEPNDEEFKASTELANKYMQEQEEEERQWFIKQEQDLLKQLINDFQVEDFIAGNLPSSILEGELDEETIKAIYAGEGEDSLPSNEIKKAYKKKKRQNHKKPPQKETKDNNKELFYDENMFATGKSSCY